MRLLVPRHVPGLWTFTLRRSAVRVLQLHNTSYSGDRKYAFPIFLLGQTYKDLADEMIGCDPAEPVFPPPCKDGFSV